MGLFWFDDISFYCYFPIFPSCVPFYAVLSELNG